MRCQCVSEKRWCPRRPIAIVPLAALTHAAPIVYALATACSTLQRARRSASVQCVAAPEQGELVWVGLGSARRGAQVLPPLSPLPAACCRRRSRISSKRPSGACHPAATTQVQRNKNMGKLQAGYLFPEVCGVGGWAVWGWAGHAG